jgi:hypothetical protein
MTKYIVAIAFALILIFFFPFAAIWSVNTLFALGIEYTLDTWLAAFLLISLLQGNGLTFRRNKS